MEKDWPVTAVYVGNALVLGYDYHDTARGLAALRAILDELLLVNREIVEPCKGLGFVGVCLDRGLEKCGKHRREPGDFIMHFGRCVPAAIVQAGCWNALSATSYTFHVVALFTINSGTSLRVHRSE